MSSDEPTPEQQKAMAEIGQKIVGLIGDEVDAKGLGDLQFVIDILVSVTAHYLAGIRDEKIRETVYEQLGDGLRRAIAAHVEAGKGAPIHVLDATKPRASSGSCADASLE